jgi:hypothetical protein
MPNQGIERDWEKRATFSLLRRPFKSHFYKTGSGTEPVRKWLQSLSLAHKKAIGEDIKTV